MLRGILRTFGAIWGVGLLVLALWAWRNDGNVAFYLGARNPGVASWGVRCGAIAALSAGEGLLVMLVLGTIWRRDWFTKGMGLSALAVFLVSSASAVALGLAGR